MTKKISGQESFSFIKTCLWHDSTAGCNAPKGWNKIYYIAFQCQSNYGEVGNTRYANVSVEAMLLIRWRHFNSLLPLLTSVEEITLRKCDYICLQKGPFKDLFAEEYNFI